ncbi:hypothetical protein H2200_001050 [Cladophialophora chaetospira]|uniref:NAD(P)-binding protein n=1 Tax=Cladophialophora chaetospira TaxID=386627 RepID=A0AA38XK85_9EURO|nr:hypothetical protein H2200_001050 [Cladophialophora chaetospira]
MDKADPSLGFTLPFQLTKAIRRDPYAPILPSQAENRQDGRIILVTGGGSGIGAAAARVWVQAGAQGVVITGRRADRLEKIAAELKKLNGKTKILAVPTDLTVEESVQDLFVQVQKAFGRAPDVILASAGTMAPPLSLHQQPLNAWWKDYETNVRSLFITIQCFLRSQPDPSNARGSVFLVSSTLAGLVVPTRSSYATSKLAAQRLIEYLDAEYPMIRAFTLAPGIVETEILDKNYLYMAKDHEEMTGMLCLWLMRPEAEFLRGQFVSVNWDVDELLEHKDRIEEAKLLQIKWHPVLPCGGNMEGLAG